MDFFSRFRQRPEATAKVEGLLGYYGLNAWWLTTFTAQERENMEADWGYITFRGSPIVNECPLTLPFNQHRAADNLGDCQHEVEQVEQGVD